MVPATPVSGKQWLGLSFLVARRIKSASIIKTLIFLGGGHIYFVTPTHAD